jgi:hypothetical protein|nr:MAG TPA: hypothetical protein [Caudoviricetes sp.]
MAGNITAYITEYNQDDKSTDIASKYGNGWMRLNRSGNYKDTINILPEEVKLSELAKSDIKDIKLDILNDYFGRTLITAQGNVARIIIREHPDIDQFNKKAKPKFFYSVDAATGREVKDTVNFKPGSGFVFSDNPETKIRASFVEETVGVGKDKVTYYGFNRARYKNVKKQLYPTWECKRNPGVATMVFVSRKDNPKAYPDIVFYRIDNDQTKVDFVQLDGNTGTISNTYYSLNIESNDAFRIGVDQYIAIYQPEMSMIRARDGELVPLEISATPSGKFIPAPNDSLAELMYNDIISQHNLAIRANINEYTPISGDLPNTGNSGSIRWFHRAGRVIPTNVVVPISGVNYTPSKLGLKTAQEWNELDEANRLYDDTPIWLAEFVIPMSDELAGLELNDDFSGRAAYPYYTRRNSESKFLLRIPCKPVSGPISQDLNNYFGFVPINDQYLEISNGPHLWHGPLRTSAGDISRVGSEAKQLKGKVTFQNDALGFMGVIYRGLMNNAIGARKWLEWQVNLWLTTYMKRPNQIFNGGVSDVNCTLQTTDGVVYGATIKFQTKSGTSTKVISDFINLNTVDVIYHKDLATYRDNGFKQRDSFIGSVNLNNTEDVMKSIFRVFDYNPNPYRAPGQQDIKPNKEYWMKYIIPRLRYGELYMRVAVMTDGVNLRPTYAYQDIQLHGFTHTGLSFINRIPENDPDNRKADTIYATFGNPNEPTQRTEYLHTGVPHYTTGNRGNTNNPSGYFRLPANLDAYSIVGQYNFNLRNPNLTYIAQGNGWGFTGNADKDNWYRGNLHQLVNFEPSSTARLFRDKPIYTMVPWENGQVDYQYIYGYLHGTIIPFDYAEQRGLNYLPRSSHIKGSSNEVILGGYFPCLSDDYFVTRFGERRDEPPETRFTVYSYCDIAPLVRVASSSPLLPHEWKPYEGNVAELIDGISSTMIENPLYDYMDNEAWLGKLFDNYDPARRYDSRSEYDFNKKGHPITTYDHHLDTITFQRGPRGLIEQFSLPNQNKWDNIYNKDHYNNPRYRSILYTRQRAFVLGIGATYGAEVYTSTVEDIRGIRDNPDIENSPQSWLITVGLDILIEHAKRLKGTPKDLRLTFAKIFAKHGIPDSKWLPQWEQGPEVFFLQNEIWLDYFFASSKLIQHDIVGDDNVVSLVRGRNVYLSISETGNPVELYRETIERL